MKNNIKCFSVLNKIMPLFSFILLFGCADLTVIDLRISDSCPSSADTVIFSATVKNRSTWRKAKANSLSFKIGNEASPAIFPIPELLPNQTFAVNRAMRLSAGNYSNEVKADILNEVRESRENNNNATFNYVVRFQPELEAMEEKVYDEGLATILRGVIIGDQDALALQIPPGYYKVREFRQFAHVDQKVIALCIEKNYGELAAGNSILPKNTEPWVFSIIQNEIYQPGLRQFEGFDRKGHAFWFKMNFDEVKSCWQIKAGIDCSEISLTTQTYTTNVFNTCVPNTEPAWTPL